MAKTFWLRTVVGLLFIQCAVAGCAAIGGRPEVNPDKWAPPKATAQWVPNEAAMRPYAVGNNGLSRPVSAWAPTGPVYGLTALIDIALRNNPATRRQWERARSAAAGYGAAQAPYYPQIGVQSAQGYQRTIIELPAAVGKLEQWQSQPTAELTYVLLDFGRRRSAAEAAFDRLIASNFAFNRAIQNVVFTTQSAFYSIDAAHAAISAAQQNLKLAETDFDAVKQRVDLGLATEPELLLSKERVAQSRFDLANARLLVHDAQAEMAMALGIPANEVPATQDLESQTVPASLHNSVERLIARACAERPDLAAQAANVRAGEAAVSQAKAQFYPNLALSASYGENLWNFTFNVPSTVQTGQPQYVALLTLRWNLFTGFKRLNDLRRAQADREAARADLESLEINTIAQVWRAYSEFESSLSKYQYARSLLDAANESYEANLQTYHQGLSTIVELLTAQRDLAQARYTLIQSKAELLTADAAVAYAAGSISIP
jgi:outer membrane protein